MQLICRVSDGCTLGFGNGTLTWCFIVATTSAPPPPPTSTVALSTAPVSMRSTGCITRGLLRVLLTIKAGPATPVDPQLDNNECSMSSVPLNSWHVSARLTDSRLPPRRPACHRCCRRVSCQQAQKRPQIPASCRASQRHRWPRLLPYYHLGPPHLQIRSRKPARRQ